MVGKENIEVVISGIGGLLPKSKNVEEFEKNLFSHEEMVRKERPDFDPNITFGFLDDKENFDYPFFGIIRTLAVHMDVLYRKALESSFEAIVDAGINPTTLYGRKIAVIINSTLADNELICIGTVDRGTGIVTQARSMLANRISYWMHATGPSFSLHNNWNGGMSALEIAYNLIKSGTCEGAIVGAINTVATLPAQSNFIDINLISKDGKTKSFDENADGYVRSDSVVVLFVQRADLARRHYSTISHVESMFNGNNSGTFTTMSVDSASKFLTNFYKRAQVDPNTVEYVETYGAGLKNMDKFEINVLEKVFINSQRTDPLLIGSVKSNMGHAEAASVFAGVVKTIIAMENRKIPANLNYTRKNQKIPALRDGKIRVVTENTPWSGNVAAVNAYGIVSSCGHILLKSNTQSIKKDTLNKKLPHLYFFSTRTEEGAQEIIKKIKSYDTLNEDYMNLINNVFSYNISGHLYRGCLLRNDKNKAEDEVSHYNGDQRPVWFVYSGMGSQWITMGKDLMNLPIFAEAIYKCHAILEPHGIDLIKIICSNENLDVFNKVLHSFIGIAAIQIGLTDVLYALGITPDNIIGHSVGELGCAYADGSLTAEQMILSAYYRGRASQEVELIPGLMAAVGMGASKIKSFLPESVDIACRNGPESCTLSGPAEDMRQLVERLQGSNIFARTVDVAGVAYHSRYIKPAAPILYGYLKKIIPNPKLRSAKWLCSSIPEASDGWKTETAKYASAEYLTNNLLSCVHFEPLLKYIPSDAIVIEIAPHGLLQAILKRSIPNTCSNIALTKRGEERSVEFLFKNIGKLYLAGLQPNILELYRYGINKCETLAPCARGTPSLAPLLHWNYKDLDAKSSFENKVVARNEITYALNLNSEHFHHLTGHCIYDIDDNILGKGVINVPLSAYLLLIAKNKNNNDMYQIDNIVFEDVQLYRHRIIPDQMNTEYPPIRIMTLLGTDYFEVNDRYGVIAAGRCINSTKQQIMPNNNIAKQKIGQKINELDCDDLYRIFTNRGHNFQNVFRAVHKLEVYERGMIANIEWKNEWHTFISTMLQMAIFRYGQSSHRPVDVVYFKSLAYSMNKFDIFKENSIIEVVYNYITDTISSSIITISGSRCQPYKIESDVLIADKCYFIEPPKNFTGFTNDDKIAAINIQVPISIADLKSELSWVKQLNKSLYEENFKYIYLITRFLPVNGIDSFFVNVQAVPDGNRVRLIVVLDKDAPEFNTIADRFYQPAFKQRESNVSVYSKGAWEYRYTVSIKLDRNAEKDTINSFISEQDIIRYLPDVNVRYVGINTVSMVSTLSNNLSFKNQLGVIDYAGLERKNHQQVMGLASINKKNSLKSDAILRWTMPKDWSIADGATVPFAYSIAYYAICECANLKTGESILIHNGCSSVGQAMIRIAASKGCTIYTTVASQKQRLKLLNTMLESSNMVFDYTSNSFEMKIMEATGGKGVNVLVNCLPEDSLRAGLRCVSLLGRVIFLYDENRLEEQYQESIGLSLFLRCLGMYGICATKILDLPNETKRVIYEHVLNGLQNGQVLPISKTFFRKNGKQPLDNIIKYLTGPTVTGTAIVPIEDLVINKHLSNCSNQVHKVDSTYIISGGEDVDNIITLTHWLASSYGSKNILVLSSHSRTTSDKNYLERNLTTIRTEQKGIFIKLLEIAVNKPDNVIQQIMQQKIINIASVLILSDGNNQGDEIFIKKLQTKFTNTHIVLLGSIANANLVNLERYQNRNIANVSFLRWDQRYRLTSVINSLTAALDEVVDIFVRNDEPSESCDNVTNNFSLLDFCSLLSTSVSSILKYAPVKSSVSVESMVSRNPRRTVDLAPVFVVPGLLGSKCTYLQKTIQNLWSPAYILDADYGTLSLDQLATRLGEQIRKIYPSGPYNLIGISTGGPLTIELAKHLETDLDATVQLYLLDGIPDTIKQLLKLNDKKYDYEATLLKEFLNITDHELVAKISALPNWAAKIDVALQYSSYNYKQMKPILQSLKDRIDAAISYSPAKRNFNGRTHVIIPENTTREYANSMDDLLQVKLKTIKGNHFTILQERSLVDYINKNMIHPKFYFY